MRRIALASVVAAVCSLSGTTPADEADGAYFSQRLGGEGVSPQRIAVAPDGAVYVAGETTAFDLPGTVERPQGTGSHVFVSAFSRSGDALWTTYLPPPDFNSDPVQGLTVGADGGIWVVADVRGLTATATPPGADPRYLMTVAKLSPDGSVASVLGFGGTSPDTPYALAAADDGDVVVAGVTASPDFPVVGAASSPHSGNKIDGFVVRVCGDGSGLAWSTCLGGPAYEGATAVALDAMGDVLVALHGRDTSDDNQWDTFPWNPVASLDLVRLRGDGAYAGRGPLPHADEGGVLALLPSPEGSVLAGGTAIYGDGGRDYGARRGFVATIAPDGTPSATVWREDGTTVAQIARTASGEIVVTLERPVYYLQGAQSVVVLLPALEFGRTLLAEDEARSIACTAVAADGTLCVAGRGLALAYGPGSAPPGARDAFVATMPVSGAAPARDLRALRPRERSVDLAWQGGDAVLRYEVERLVGEEDDAHYELAASAPASARGARIHGLRPGTTSTMRVVSVFASGARSASAPLRVSTRPTALANATAEPVDGSRIRVRWSNAPRAPDADFEIERQLGDAPFRRIPWSPYWSWFDEHARDEFFDALPPLDRLRVRYRVRAVTTDPRVRSAWTYTPAVETLRSNLVVRQVRGSVTHFKGDLLRIRIEGSYATPGESGGAAGFDPKMDEISIIAGDADRPLVARVRPQSYESFRKLDDDWYRVIRDTNNNDCPTDYGQFADYYWFIDFHPARGRFEILAYACTPLEFRPSSDRIVLGLAYGDRAGGELKTWRRLPGPGTHLELR